MVKTGERITGVSKPQKWTNCICDCKGYQTLDDPFSVIVCIYIHLSLGIVESEAALMGIRKTNALGIKKVIIEGDSFIIIQSLPEALEDYPREIKICITNCKHLLSCFQSIVFNHVNWFKNKIADKLAKDRCQGLANGWNVIPPHWLYKALSN